MALSNGESSLSMASATLKAQNTPVVTLRHNVTSPDLVTCGTESHGCPSARCLCLLGASGPTLRANKKGTSRHHARSQSS